MKQLFSFVLCSFAATVPAIAQPPLEPRFNRAPLAQRPNAELPLADEKRSANQNAACAIQVIDKETGWPVPLVELRTTHYVRFVTDNAGRIAFNLPELMGQETAFEIISDGYEVPADKLGFRGVRLKPEPGRQFTVEVKRTSIAKRLGRLTGAGLFAESQALRLERDWRESGIVGCDTLQIAEHHGKLIWAWGDTIFARHPIGIYDSTGATTPAKPLKRFEPPIQLKYSYFADAAGRPRAIAKMPGDGPTWLSGIASVPDKSGKNRLVASYVKIDPPLEPYSCGLCVWNDEESRFEQRKILWTKTDEEPRKPAMPQGHAVMVDGDDGRKWMLFGDPLPRLRCPATFENWQDPSKWETLKPQRHLRSATDESEVRPHTGSIAWNAFRQRWVTVFMQGPFASGEIWYAEADAPTGPWGPAVKILSHKNYTFYNPLLHADFTPDRSPILLFEGTYTKTFANNPEPTPRYEYNQVLYRIDLDDPRLIPAQR